MAFLLLWAFGIISAFIHFFITGFPDNAADISTILLLHQFVVTFCMLGIIGVIVNIFMADKTAKRLGWPGGQFQIKYGFSQFGVGVMGVMAIWFGGTFWIGVLVNMYVYGLSGLWSHTKVMIDNKKVDADSIGNIIMDIAYQAFITILSVLAGGIWIVSSQL